MKNLKFYLLVPLLSLCYSCSSPVKQQEHPFAILAYYVPEQDYHPEKLPLGQLTHIIFSFTKVIDGEMKFRNEESGEKLKQLVAQRKNHPHLKVMVACGGWAADGFSDMVYTQESRDKFVESVVRFITNYDLDGLDIDWEYPTIPAAGTMARPEDKHNFTLLMKSLREALDTLKRKQTLTFATPGYKGQYQNLELNEVMNYADYINIMTYDQRVGSAPFAGHHTALGWIKEADMKGTPAMELEERRKEEMAKHGLEYDPESAEMIVNYLMKLGVKPEQMVIGAAFYGRIWKGVPPENNGLYQPNKGPVQDGVRYADIRKDYET
ncbi:MAG TPA: glycosyl hydrolase family 18 protein, partial [Flavobacteriaceae bacterium]|nr:glycosyl hydrolase family 18 protein [Flavobacteriaceae bacterium]